MSDLDPDDIERIRTTTLQRVARQMTALCGCTMLPGSPPKRFVRDVCRRKAADLTQRQREHVVRLAWRYRRQMPRELVPTINPDDPLCTEMDLLRMVAIDTLPLEAAYGR